MVSAAFKRILSPCFKPSSEGNNSASGSEEGRVNGLLWYKDLGQHVAGEFSMAVIQANSLLEDYSQLESVPLSSVESGFQGTFVGIYDGHGGPEAARFVNDRLFENLKKFTTENVEMSAEIITKAFLATEEEFLNQVRRHWLNKPLLASVGSCCLVGIICSRFLFIANAGDSRVVLGRKETPVKEVKAVQLSSDHNASVESVREELRSLHPDDPQIVVQKQKVWRVKGIIQISRSIGDAYLKSAEFNREPLLSRFRVSNSFDKPILKAEPEISVTELCPEDQFLIFASDGLWDILSNQKAVDIVQKCSRNGSARKLIKAALHEVAKQREIKYSDLKEVGRGVRRHFHDDITVIVLFLDKSYLDSHSTCDGPVLSIRGGSGLRANTNY